MFLKQIEMENFKSFQKKTIVPLLEGYTAVTGPNGSGKSNIADAVLFVLGPRSSKLIRAGRLTDLIFNGGKSGQKAKYCKVSLIFDNRSRTLPIDSDSVKLTRLVKLSPSTPDGYYSYFYVNGKKSSLSEFDSLLAHARISADGYNIVQQGDVSRIVGMGKVERRKILDSIAGITKFDDDISRAEKRRQDVENNLERISIILDEIRRQIRQLDKDRIGALRYKELKERLNLAKAQMAHKNVEMIQAEINSTKESIRKFEAEKEKLSQLRNQLKEQLSEAENELKEIEARIEEKGGEEAKEMKKRMDHLRVERARAEDAVETLTEENTRLKEEIDSTNEEVQKVKEEIEELDKKRKVAKEKLSELEKLVRTIDEELLRLEKSACLSDNHIINLRKSVISLERLVDQTNDKIHKLTLENDRLSDRLERLHNEAAELEEDIKTYNFELKDAEWQIKEIRAKDRGKTKDIQSLRKDHKSLLEREKQLSQQAQILEDAIRSLSREYNNLKAEAQAAASVEKGYNRAVLAILEARDRREIKGIHGSIAELCQVDKKYETAIKVAAGNRLQAIVVDNDLTGERCINYLKKKGLGRAIFLPLNKMIPGRPRGKAVLARKESLGYAVDLITFDEKYANAFWYVLADTIVVRNLKEARRLMGGVRIATLHGELIESSGAMIGGTLQKSALKFGAPSQKEIQKLGEQLRRAIEESEKVAKEIQDVRLKIQEVESSLREMEDNTQSSEIKITGLKAKEKEFRAKVKHLEKELEKNRQETLDAEERRAVLGEEIKKLTSELEKLKRRREEEKKKIVISSPEEIQRKIAKLQTEKSKVLDERNEVRSNLETLETQTKVLSDRLNELKERVKSDEEELKKNARRIESSKKKHQEMDHELRAMKKLEDSMGKEMKRLREKRDDAYKLVTSIRAEIEKNLHQSHTKEDFILGLQNELRVGKKKLEEALKELKELNVEVGNQIPPTEELNKIISECETAIETMGPVNLRALEDYEVQQNRHKELSEEYRRLESQKRDLIKLVEKLNERKKDGLFKVFHGINDEFKRVYNELSDGGEAELILENEEEPFEGGLIIKAKPHNKRVHRLEALSGGEKSLVSMAFIFAIQQYDPSPFYLLDEVDQNLDAINAEKVARMIKANSSSAQFVQISLRKVTLKEADHIIGVTMQRSGISDVVMSVNIGELPKEEDQERPQEVAT